MPDVITCTSEGDDPRGRRRQGVNRPDDAPAGQCKGASLVPSSRETRPLVATGNPCASRMIPLESPVPARRVRRAGGGNVPTGIGLRPGCESAGRATDPLPVTRLPSTLHCFDLVADHPGHIRE